MVTSKTTQRVLKNFGFYGLVIFFMLPTVFVFYWMITCP